MIIVIEGARGTGKTTFAKWLTFALELYGWWDLRLPPVKYTKFKRGAKPHEDMKCQIDDMMRDGLLHIVDRFHITEFVMEWWRKGASDRMALPLLDTQRDIITRKLAIYGAFVYIITADTEIVFDRVTHRSDPARRRDVNYFILSTFDYAARRDQIPLIKNNTWQDMVKGIWRILKDVRRVLE